MANTCRLKYNLLILVKGENVTTGFQFFNRVLMTKTINCDLMQINCALQLSNLRVTEVAGVARHKFIRG